MKVGSRKGFSLIEIGIVMVVIGLIIAAVMKGKDVIKNAEVKESTQNFMSKWVNAMDSIYDKQGYNFNGSSANRAIMGYTTSTKPIRCTDLTENNVTSTFEQAGINVTQLVKSNTNNLCTQTISGEFTQDSVVGLNYAYITVDSQAKNSLVFSQVPTDVAKAFDKLIDGVIAGDKGRVMYVDGTSATLSGNTEKASLTYATITSAEWPTVAAEGVVDVVVTLEH